MELLLPGIGLLTWTILALVSFVLTIIALISVAGNKQLDVAAKFIWAF